MRLRSAGWALALFLVAASASAQGSYRTVELGDGLSVRRSSSIPCGYRGCAGGWAPTGFAFGSEQERLQRARVWALARGGRIVAAVESAVLYSDDRGLHWTEARLENASVSLFSFDRNGDLGAAVTDNGALLLSEDNGAHWRSRREGAGATVTGLGVLGRAVVLADSRGGVWVTSDGGTTLRELVAPAASTAGASPASVQVTPTAVVIQSGGQRLTVNRDGELQRN